MRCCLLPRRQLISLPPIEGGGRWALAEMRDRLTPARGISSEAEASSQVHRFYIPTALAGVAQGALVRMPPEEARHATRTLRLGEGDPLELCDGRGTVTRGEIAALDKSGALVRTVAAPRAVPRGNWNWEVALACGSLKGGRADWVVEKCTELGAAALVPLLTERSPAIGGAGESKTPASKRRKRASEEVDFLEGEGGGEGGGRERWWQRVATSAMKQCLRAHSMRIAPPCTVAQLCAGLDAADLALVGAAGAPPVHLAICGAAERAGSSDEEQWSSNGSSSKPWRKGSRGVLIIGPEGDFTPQEIEQLQAAGAVPVGLGPLRLRAETAAVGMLSFVTLALPDRGSITTGLRKHV